MCVCVCVCVQGRARACVVQTRAQSAELVCAPLCISKSLPKILLVKSALKVDGG